MNLLTLKWNSGVNYWTQKILLVARLIKFLLIIISTSLSNGHRPPPLVSVSQWFTSRTRNSRYLTSCSSLIEQRPTKRLKLETEVGGKLLLFKDYQNF